VRRNPAVDPLDQMLTRLRLNAIRDQLDTLLDEAARRELTLRDALQFLCEREIARKDERRVAMGMKLAKFPAVRELSGFDFGAQPSVDEKQIRELATGRFIAHGESVLFLGPPGVGKTHLAVAVGRGAILSGYTVLFTTAAALVANLAKAHLSGRLDEQLTLYTKPKLLIVDLCEAGGYVELALLGECFPTQQPDALHITAATGHVATRRCWYRRWTSVHLSAERAPRGTPARAQRVSSRCRRAHSASSC